MANYKTSWVQRLIDGVWQKTFAFAHAKTVYTDYENKKTLDKSLEEVQKRISDNGYGEVAGGKNLFFYNDNVKFEENSNKYQSFTFDSKTDNSVRCYVPNSGSYTAAKLNIYGLKPSAKYSASCSVTENTSEFSPRIYCTESDSDGTLAVNLSLNNGTTISGSGYYVTFSNIQVEEGEIATEYEPYYPSNKMLAEENSQQSKEMIDIKMLGWSVPKECPIQNEVNGNQFTQKVGRVDLGSLDWGIQTTGDDFFYSTDISTNLKKQIGYTENWGYCVGYSIIKLDKSTSKTKVIFADNVGNIFVRDTRYTTEKDLQTALHGVYLYYELATPITTTIDGNEIGETVSDVRKETTVNLLNPTLQTTTKNGITITNNGDGTYTLDGTASANAYFTLETISKFEDKIYKIVSFKNATSMIYSYINAQALDGAAIYSILKENAKPTGYISKNKYISFDMGITVISGTNLTNEIVKPMLTTNLDATYDDFVPYTGNTGRLNGDVANLRDDVNGIEKEVSTQKINIHYGTGDGNNIVPVKGTDYIKTPPILVNNSANTFEDAQEGSSGGGGLNTIDYTYAKEGNVKFTILDPLIDVNTNVSGLVVTPASSALRNGHYYRIRGTATEDATIPLYSVKNPSSNTLLFVSELSGEMSEGTFYYLISDTAGNTKQFETEKNKNTVFSGHSGEVKVSLVVKSGTKVSSTANVRAGYSKVYSVMDRSDKKYSDTADTVIDAIMEMKSK